MIEHYIPQLQDMYPDLLYACVKCGHTKKVSGIGTNLPDLTCRCEYPEVINEMIEMIPKLPVKKPKDTRLGLRLRRQWRQKQ